MTTRSLLLQILVAVFMLQVILAHSPGVSHILEWLSVLDTLFDPLIAAFYVLT